MGVLTLNKIYPDRSNALKMRTRITITGLFLLAVAAALLNIEQQSSLAFAAREEDKDVLYVCKEDTTTDVFEFVSGIFAAILFVLSLRAYRNLKIKSILYVSAAFGIFAARTIAIEKRTNLRRRNAIRSTVIIVNHVSYGYSAILYRNRPKTENKAKAFTTRYIIMENTHFMWLLERSSDSISDNNQRSSAGFEINSERRNESLSKPTTGNNNFS
jgi:hypothetical protein